MTVGHAPREGSWLHRLGLHRPELRAWALYDWANSVFMTTIIQLFPIYFVGVAAADLPRARASYWFALSTTVAMTGVALLAPILGAIADYAAVKKKMLGAFMGLGVLSTASMFFIERGDWVLAAVLFVLGNVGVSGSFVFYDSLLPHVAREDEVDRVSTAGYALGYLGGGALLALNLAWIEKPHLFGIPDDGMAVRLSFLSAALWWLGFSIPLFRRVPEPPRRLETDERAGENPFRAALQRLGETLRELRGYREAFLMILAFMIYGDGISTIIRMAASYGTEIGIPRASLIGSILVVQFAGIPFSFLFGGIAGRIGAKAAIFIALAVYVAISVIGYRMTTPAQFLLLATLVGMVQGGSQALSRSLFSTLIPRHRSSEFFAFFAVFEKFAGIAGPAVFAGMIHATGSSRTAILALILFFVAGGGILAFVDVPRGQRLAREAEARALGLAGAPAPA